MAKKDKSWLPVYLAVIVAVLTYISFSPSNQNGWTNWDDPFYVTENPVIQKNEISWKDIFTKPVAANYHPLTMLTLAWNYQLADKQGKKIDARVFHEWNVWLHVMNTLLVFYFIWLLSGGQLITAAFTAAIFGVHPMHVESVSWVSERKDVLYAFFFISSCISYLWYLDRKKTIYLVLSFILFGLSCLSKAMAVVIPLVFFAIDYFRSRKWEWGVIIEKIPFLLLSLCIGIKAVQIQVHPAFTAHSNLAILFRLFLFGSYGAVMYILKFFAPFSLSAFYPYPDLPIPFFYYIAPIVWPALAFLAWVGHKKNKALSFGIVFFLVNVILVLQFMPVGGAIIADRYTYISYIGIAFTIGSLCYALIKKFPATVNTIYLACTIFIIFLATKTYSRTQVWKDSGTRWSDVSSKYSEAEINNYRLYYYYNDPGFMYNGPMDLKPVNTKDSRDYDNMGNIYRMKYQLDSAIWAYNRSLALDSNNADVYMNRGMIYLLQRQYDSAIADFNKEEKLAGVSVQLLQNLANTCLAAGKYQQGLDNYNKLLQLKPDDGLLYNNRAMVNEQLNNYSQAYADLQKAISLGFKVDTSTMWRIKMEAGK